MRHDGFTLVELVVALAAGTVLTVVVYSCTISSISMSTRQREAARVESELSTAVRVLNDDIVGWLDRSPFTVSDTRTTLLAAFITGADPLFRKSDDAERSCEIRYLSRSVLARHELVRIENLVNGEMSELILCRCSRPITVGFFDGKGWSTTWNSNNRPIAVRFQMDDRTETIKL